MEQEKRALQIARINAKRRDAEGLNMAPHPGNRMDSVPENGDFRSEKADAYATTKGAGKGNYEEKAGSQESQSGSSQESGEESYTTGGYQPSEYEPAEYQISEYKSVYDS